MLLRMLTVEHCPGQHALVNMPRSSMVYHLIVCLGARQGREPTVMRSKLIAGWLLQMSWRALGDGWVYDGVV